MLLPYQGKVKRVYDATPSQIFVASMIFLNLIISAVEAQVGLDAPAGSVMAEVFGAAEWFFTLIFSVELCVNFYSNCLCPFFKDPWNDFDAVIIAISWVSLAGDVEGVQSLKVLRAFRVFKLFKKIERLRILIVGILKSVPFV